MTIYWATGFEWAGSDDDVRSWFDYISSTHRIYYTSADGFLGTKGARTGDYQYVRKYFPGGKTRVIGGHIRSSVDNFGIMGFYGPEVNIRVDNGATRLAIYRGSTLLDYTPSGTWGATMHHLEVKVFSDSSVGTVDIKVDGDLVYSGTGLNTGGADITGFYNSPNSPYFTYYDNLFAADDWVGEMHIVGLSPASDFDCDFTPSTGSDNYAMVDDEASDGDATYNYSDTVDATDLFEYETYSERDDIVFVGVVTDARKTEAGPRKIKHQFLEESSLYDGEEKTLNTSYFGTYLNPYLHEILNTTPSGAAWTSAILNDLKIGYKISE